MYQSAMAIATAPGKQLFMTAFMLYMSGNTLQIFSIMMLVCSLLPLSRSALPSTSEPLFAVLVLD